MSKMIEPKFRRSKILFSTEIIPKNRGFFTRIREIFEYQKNGHVFKHKK